MTWKYQVNDRRRRVDLELDDEENARIINAVMEPEVPKFGEWTGKVNLLQSDIDCKSNIARQVMKSRNEQMLRLYQSFPIHSKIKMDY